MEINETMHGFKLCRKEKVEEIGGEVWLAEHIKSGARLIYLPADDENKVFAIAFATPPTDDRGTSHIIEHGVLCGSRKYPLKEPFVDLAKGSLNTFLNAITYPDFTVYPVASCNAKDFRNLTDVYLDAVFYPLICENPRTLQQEGWHYEIERPDEPLTYNGVVYNEMKGVYSSPDAYLERAAMQALFPATSARFESGGLPGAIPGLDQEAYVNFHRRYYRPDNAYIFLYGDMDIDETLAYLDREYLSAFTKRKEARPPVQWQEPLLRTAEVRATYPGKSGEAAETFLQWSVVCGKSVDLKKVQALRLLQAALTDKEGSPLRQALLDAGIGQSISSSVDTYHPQCTFNVTASGCKEEQRDEFLSTIYRTLQKLTIKGLDKERLSALLDAAEFKLREADFSPWPKGLCYGLAVLGHTLAGGEPAAVLRYEKNLQELRAALKGRYFENIIEGCLLDNTHRALITLVPDPEMEKAEAAATAAELAAKKASMSDEETAACIETCRELRRRQAEPDSEEAKECIPTLARNDIRKNILKLPTEEETLGDDRLIYLPQKSNGVVYLKLFFRCRALDFKSLPLCYLLTEFLGRTDSADYRRQELPTLLYGNSGGLSFGFGPYAAIENTDDFELCSNVSVKALPGKLPKLLQILESILVRSRYDDGDHFRTLLEDSKRGWDDNVFAEGRTHAKERLQSYFSRSGLCAEQGGLTYYHLLKKLTADYPRQREKLSAELQDLLPRLFHKGDCSFFYSCREEDRAKVALLLKNFLNALPAAPAAVPLILPSLEAKNEGFYGNGTVQYVLAGGNFRKAGFNFHGSMAVLETLLNYEYLWTKVRMQGGAYGAGARFEQSGSCFFSSYRDPRLGATLAAYRGLPAYLEKLRLSDREMDRYVIGTMSGVDKPWSPWEKLDAAATYDLRGVSDRLRQQNRDQILNVSLQELRALAQVVQAVLEEQQLCVIGSRAAIMQERNLFRKIIEL